MYSNWSKCITWLNIPQLNLGNIPVIFPNFQNYVFCKKYFKDDKHNSLHLGKKYARIFCPWTCVPESSFSAHFPRVTLLENCLLLRTDNVCRQISEYVSMPNRGCCLFSIIQLVDWCKSCILIGYATRGLLALFPNKSFFNLSD